MFAECTYTECRLFLMVGKELMKDLFLVTAHTMARILALSHHKLLG